MDLKKICACTVVYEGSLNEVNYQKALINKIAKTFNGINAGSDSGMKGYFLTFIIAYIRDFAAEHCYIAESFETSCPWGKVSSLISNVRERAYKACEKRGIRQGVYISFRVTQLYETGAAVYVYFGYSYAQNNIPKEKSVHVYEEVENECRDEVMKQGGSLSHHHGIGKIRKRFMTRVYP